MWFVLDLR